MPLHVGEADCIYIYIYILILYITIKICYVVIAKHKKRSKLYCAHVYASAIWILFILPRRPPPDKQQQELQLGRQRRSLPCLCGGIGTMCVVGEKLDWIDRY